MASVPLQKIVLPGGAGLVGQNLAARLCSAGVAEVVVIDKHRANLDILRTHQPRVEAVLADLSTPGDWQAHCQGADAVVMLQAQIGGLDAGAFERNTVQSTRQVLQALRDAGVPCLVHVSSSVVSAGMDDLYTRAKQAQEQLVLESELAGPVLRPTLMFGWFDRKHLGWLSRFMQRVPVFPVPGHGRWPRQPLYVGDFCDVILGCLRMQWTGRPREVIDITGQQTIDYIDIVRAVRDAMALRTPVLPVPVPLFRAALAAWSWFDRDPPFSTQQLDALLQGDTFAGTDWPQRFGITPTPFEQAVLTTFQDPRFSRVVLGF